ncbi:MAG: hypothetical protein RTU92_14625 [Candidatus Thorarchaeota archaeon]
MTRMLMGFLVSMLILSPVIFIVGGLPVAIVNGNLTLSEGYTSVNEYTSYFGGSSAEWSFDAAIDSVGNLIFIADTTSANMPILNAYQSNYSGNGDSFIAKFSPQNQLIFATYIGGDYMEYTNGICVDSEDNIIVVGSTFSRNFPVYNALIANHSGGQQDAYIAKFSPEGELIFSTYFGGSDNDWFFRLTTDSDDNLLVIGTTLSDDINTTEDAVQSDHRGSEDVMIVKLSEDGQSVELCTYFGTTSTDQCTDIKYDRAGDIVFTAVVHSADNVTSGAFQDTYGGGTGDTLIAKLDSNATILHFATLLGGDDWDFGGRLGFDSNNSIIVSGYTYSADFPLERPYQDTHGGINDAFITKLNSTGESLIFSTTIGGSGEEQMHGGVVLDDDSIVISGYSSSPDYPKVHSIHNETQGLRDSCVIHLSADGQSLLFSSLLGGARNDAAEWVDVDSDGKYILVGYTSSDELPVVDAFQSDYGTGRDVLISKLSLQTITSTTSSTSTTSTTLITTSYTSTTTPTEFDNSNILMAIVVIMGLLMLVVVVIIVVVNKLR